LRLARGQYDRHGSSARSGASVNFSNRARSYGGIFPSLLASGHETSARFPPPLDLIPNKSERGMQNIQQGPFGEILKLFPVAKDFSQRYRWNDSRSGRDRRSRAR